LDEAAEHYQRAAALMPDSTQAHYQLGLTLQRQGKFAPAIAQFQKVLELDRRHVGAQNDLAWLLATCPEASLRNGSRAVELARELEQLSGGNLPEILDTLAAAYAEAGRFGEAVESAGRALKIAASQHDKLLADGIQTRLRLYETNLPYHEKP
jgi:tetratricopeptide (TPR) repeat protein